MQRAFITTGILGALLAAAPAFAEEEGEPFMVDKAIVILSTNASYGGADQALRRAERRLGLSVDLRDLGPDESRRTLSWSANDCEENGWSYPCYVPRGRADDGAYLSIEHTDGYPELAPRHFIVVAASGSPGAAEIKHTLARANELGLRAYVRTVRVYMGCLH